MPLTQLSATVSLTAAMSRSNNYFPATTEGPFGMSFNLGTPSLATWNQEFQQCYTLFAVAPSGLSAVLASGGTLTVSTTYYYKITAVGYNSFSATNETSGSNEVSVTPTSGNQTANLTWTALSGAVSYNVYRGTTSGSENVLVANVATNSYSDTGSAGTSQSPPGSMPNDYVEFDLSSFTTLVNESASPGHVLGILITNTGVNNSSQLTLAPGSSNGLQWFFGGLSQSLALRINGAFLLTGPGSGDAGQAITGTAKTLRVTNGGTQATTVFISAITGP